jgi:hypothetical protein
VKVWSTREPHAFVAVTMKNLIWDDRRRLNLHFRSVFNQCAHYDD